MNKANLEHVNITVINPERTAEILCELFDWEVRWAGKSQLGGRTVHVGTESDYLALYCPEDSDNVRPFERSRTGNECGGLNHIAVTVDDLDCAERRVKKAGFEPVSHGNYEPGRRFYFCDHDGIEYEIVSYAQDMPALFGACLIK